MAEGLSIQKVPYPMQCPKCGFNQLDSNIECDRCGVIFAKLGMVPTQARTFEPGMASAAQVMNPHRSLSPPEPLSPGPARSQPRSPRAESAGRGVVIPGPPPRARESVKVIEDAGISIEDPSSLESYADYDEEFVPEPRHLEQFDLLVLVSGAIAALVIMQFPLPDHIFRTFTILVHEMGHAIAGWLFGYPSLPAFDLMYGGGVTVHWDRSTLLILVFYLLSGALIFMYRTKPLTVLVLSAMVVIHLLFSLTAAHQALILFMGHGTELVIAAIFFYRGLSGAAVVHPAERPLYCLIACFIVFSDLGFAYGLWKSPEARELYGEAKCGGHWMDFSRLANDYFHTDLATVAYVFFLCCLMPLVVGFLMFRYQEYLRYGMERLFSRHSETTP